MKSLFGVCLVTAALFVGCGAAEEPEPEAPRALRRLWRDTPPVRERLVAPGDAGVPSAVSERLFEARFDGTQSWWRGRLETVDSLAFEADLPDGGSLGLEALREIGLAQSFAVEPGQALRLRVSGEALGAADAEGSLNLAVLVQREDAFSGELVLPAKEVNRMLNPRLSRVELISAEINAGVVTQVVDFVVAERIREVWLMLLAPRFRGQEVRITELVVERLPLSEHLAAGGALPDVEEVPGGVALTLDRERREGVLVSSGEELSWELPALAQERRLDFAWGLPRWSPPDAELQVRVLVGDELLLEETLRPPSDASEAAWRDRQLQLPAATTEPATQAAPLELRVQVRSVDPDAPPVALAHPMISAALAPPRPNVILISLDTLSPDRLGCYGGDPEISTHLDALAAEGTLFKQATSVSAYTLPSHASMMSGQYPAFHGAVDVTDRIDPDRSPLLAPTLAEAGYLTAAFTGGGYVGTAFGFAAGFDRYSTNDPVWPYGTVRGELLLQTMTFERDPLPEAQLRRYGSDAIVEWLGARRDGPPFFAFVHTFIAHNYAPNERWLEERDLYLDGDRSQAAFDHRERERFNRGEDSAERESVTDDYLPYYDATIGMADDFVGELLAALEAFELDENTMVIVTSDHGEEFGEHDFFGHGLTLYATNTRVPLIVRLPGARAERAGVVVEEPVSLVDIAPWVLQTVGLEPDPRMSIAPPLGPLSLAPPRRRELFIELDNHVQRKSVVRDGALKLHVDLGAAGEDFDEPVYRLYDLVEDPAEERDLASERPEEVLRLARRLTQFHSLAQSVLPRDGEALNLCDQDPEVLQTLRALGYLGGADEAELANCDG